MENMSEKERYYTNETISDTQWLMHSRDYSGVDKDVEKERLSTIDLREELHKPERKSIVRRNGNRERVCDYESFVCNVGGSFVIRTEEDSQIRVYNRYGKLNIFEEGKDDPLDIVAVETILTTKSLRTFKEGATLTLRNGTTMVPKGKRTDGEMIVISYEVNGLVVSTAYHADGHPWGRRANRSPYDVVKIER